MLKLKFSATIQGGKLTFTNRHAFDRHLTSFKDGDVVTVTVTKKKKERSINQNAYYWGVVLAVISAETGHTPEELHEVYKRAFLPAKYIQYRDKQFKIPASTTEQSTLEFTEYIERIRAEAATLGIRVPNPDQIEF